MCWQPGVLGPRRLWNGFCSAGREAHPALSRGWVMREKGTEVADGGQKVQGPYSISVISLCSNSFPHRIHPVSSSHANPTCSLLCIAQISLTALGVSQPRQSTGSFTVFWEFISFSPEQLWVFPIRPMAQSSPCPWYSAGRKVPRSH